MFRRDIKDDPKRRPINRPFDRQQPCSSREQEQIHQQLSDSHHSEDGAKKSDIKDEGVYDIAVGGVSEAVEEESEDSFSRCSSPPYTMLREGIISKLNFIKWLRQHRLAKERAKQQKLMELEQEKSRERLKKKASVSEPMMLQVGTLASIKEKEVDQVKKFLKNNDDVLEDYVLHHTPCETIEKWMKEKNERGRLRSNKEKYLKNNKRYSGYSDIRLVMGADLPNEDQLPYSLAESFKIAMGFKGFRMYKLYPGSKNFVQEFVHAEEENENGTLVNNLILVQAKPEIALDITKIASLGHCKIMSRFKTTEKMPVIPEHILIDITPAESDALNHVCYVPITDESGIPIYIIELWCITPFETTNIIELGSAFGVWTTLAMNYAYLLHKSKKQTAINYLVGVLEAIFERQLSMTELLAKIIKFMQFKVDAQRASLFLVEEETQELVSIFFDLQFGVNIKKEKHKIRIPVESGIAGYVVKSGETANLSDVKYDGRFNRSVDLKTGYTTLNILAMPIRNGNKIIGVVEFINKKGNSFFYHRDKIAIEFYSQILSFAINHTKILEHLPSDIPFRPCESNDVWTLIYNTKPTKIKLNNFYLDPFPIKTMDKCMAFMSMFQTFFKRKRTNFELAKIARFILAVEKNYSDAPYHNFTHGFSSAQCMYTLLNHDTNHRYTINQRLGMFIAAVCHDLNHKAYPKHFIPQTVTSLAAAYSTSTLEGHQFETLMAILQRDDHDILSGLSHEDREEVLDVTLICMDASDVALFVTNLEEVHSLMTSETGEVKCDWQNQEHKNLTMRIAIIAAQFSAAAKPWAVHRKLANLVFNEFLSQNVKENETEKGSSDKYPENLPLYQIEFLNVFAIPCFNFMEDVLPLSNNLILPTIKNRERWNVIQKRQQRLKRSMAIDVSEVDEINNTEGETLGTTKDQPDLLLKGSLDLKGDEPKPGPSGSGIDLIKFDDKK